ncbi:hypothetical protein MNV49_000982 [Pseudohyphozyma bogoriensis]|nr:hypothetical protein MNV49_000982 [Pseudohyphozyma bogoriensis]
MVHLEGLKGIFKRRRPAPSTVEQSRPAAATSTSTSATASTSSTNGPASPPPASSSSTVTSTQLTASTLPPAPPAPSTPPCVYGPLSESDARAKFRSEVDFVVAQLEKKHEPTGILSLYTKFCDKVEVLDPFLDLIPPVAFHGVELKSIIKVVLFVASCGSALGNEVRELARVLVARVVKLYHVLALLQNVVIPEIEEVEKLLNDLISWVKEQPYLTSPSNWSKFKLALRSNSCQQDLASFKESFVNIRADADLSVDINTNVGVQCVIVGLQELRIEVETVKQLLHGRLFPSSSKQLPPKSLPSSPLIFGREKEIGDLVTLFTTTDTHAVVCGLGGIGKSSVALNVAHHPEIKKTFHRRLFYQCHDDTGTASLTTSLISLLQDDPPPGNQLDALRSHLGSCPSTLLILDNFESIWYHDHGVAEDFIQELADFPSLTLLITTRPRSFFAITARRDFLPTQLCPLPIEFSRKIFLQHKINQSYASDPDLPTLLGEDYLAGYPLAIRLVAAAAAKTNPRFSSIKDLLAAWKRAPTRFDAHSKDPRHSLAISLSLSTSSPLVANTPFAVDLLKFLSRHPFGFEVSWLAKCDGAIGMAMGAIVSASLAELSASDRQTIRLLPPVADHFRASGPLGAGFVSSLLSQEAHQSGIVTESLLKDGVDVPLTVSIPSTSSVELGSSTSYAGRFLTTNPQGCPREKMDQLAPPAHSTPLSVASETPGSDLIGTEARQHFQALFSRSMESDEFELALLCFWSLYALKTDDVAPSLRKMLKMIHQKVYSGKLSAKRLSWLSNDFLSYLREHFPEGIANAGILQQQVLEDLGNKMFRLAKKLDPDKFDTTRLFLAVILTRIGAQLPWVGTRMPMGIQLLQNCLDACSSQSSDVERPAQHLAYCLKAFIDEPLPDDPKLQGYLDMCNANAAKTLVQAVLQPYVGPLQHITQKGTRLLSTVDEGKSAESRSGGRLEPQQPPHPSEPSAAHTHFGFRDVPETQKESLVKGVFSSVASSYDVMNDAMSLGIHRLWKDHYVKKMNPHGGMTCLDVAGGTGDIAIRLLDHAKDVHADRETKVIVVDINPEMLEEGKKRFAKTMYHGGPQISFHLSNAEALDVIPDNSVDLYTIAFGIRNCTHVDRVLKEAYRVLRPGGVFSCLEFSKVTNPILAKAYEAYSFNVIPSMGHIIASDRDSYQYLVESIERFPPQGQFSKMIADAGFTVPKSEPWEDLTFGIAAIHTGVKL